MQRAPWQHIAPCHHPLSIPLPDLLPFALPHGLVDSLHAVPFFYLYLFWPLIPQIFLFFAQPGLAFSASFAGLRTFCLHFAYFHVSSFHLHAFLHSVSGHFMVSIIFRSFAFVLAIHIFQFACVFMLVPLSCSFCLCIWRSFSLSPHCAVSAHRHFLSLSPFILCLFCCAPLLPFYPLAPL